MKYIVRISSLFLIWRIVDFIVASFAHAHDKYHEHFIYRFQLYHNNPYIPRFLIPFANYDGAHYLHIAHDGYKQYEQAFFPLFPLMIHLLSPLFANQYFIPGFLLTNILFLLGLLMLTRYLHKIHLSETTIFWTQLFFIAFPTSFFFGAVYTEGIFFFLVICTLFLAEKKIYSLAGVSAYLAALARFLGVFLSIPLFLILLEGPTKFLSLTQFKNYLFRKHNLDKIFVIFAPLLGCISYCLYLYLTIHDPFAFYHSLEAFHTGRSIHHIILLPQVYYRYISIFFKAQWSFVYFVAVLEFFIFNFIFWVLVYDFVQLWKDKTNPHRMTRLGLTIFSLINILLPTVTGTFTSLPRYGLLSLAFFIRLAEIQHLLLKIVLCVLFLIFHFLLLYLFIQGYFIS